MLSATIETWAFDMTELNKEITNMNSSVKRHEIDGKMFFKCEVNILDFGAHK